MSLWSGHVLVCAVWWSTTSTMMVSTGDRQKLAGHMWVNVTVTAL